jgi:hypothetical protein
LFLGAFRSVPSGATKTSRAKEFLLFLPLLLVCPFLSRYFFLSSSVIRYSDPKLDGSFTVEKDDVREREFVLEEEEEVDERAVELEEREDEAEAEEPIGW